MLQELKEFCCNAKKRTCMHVHGEEKEEKKKCRNPGLNQGPLDLQSNALPTELFRLAHKQTEAMKRWSREKGSKIKILSILGQLFTKMTGPLSKMPQQ